MDRRSTLERPRSRIHASARHHPSLACSVTSPFPIPTILVVSLRSHRLFAMDRLVQTSANELLLDRGDPTDSSIIGAKSSYTVSVWRLRFPSSTAKCDVKTPRSDFWPSSLVVGFAGVDVHLFLLATAPSSGTHSVDGSLPDV